MSTHPELSIRICLKLSFPWRRIEDSLWDNLVAGPVLQQARLSLSPLPSYPSA